MNEPIMKEELVWIINKQRNRKAAGIDGIKAEMKHFIKNQKVREFLLKSFNKCINEKVNEDWLNTKTTLLLKKQRNQWIQNIDLQQ